MSAFTRRGTAFFCAVCLAAGLFFSAFISLGSAVSAAGDGRAVLSPHAFLIDGGECSLAAWLIGENNFICLKDAEQIRLKGAEGSFSVREAEGEWDAVPVRMMLRRGEAARQ